MPSSSRPQLTRTPEIPVAAGLRIYSTVHESWSQGFDPFTAHYWLPCPNTWVTVQSGDRGNTFGMTGLGATHEADQIDLVTDLAYFVCVRESR